MVNNEDSQDTAARSRDNPFSEVLQTVLPVAQRFREAGYELYLVGGVVRDIALGAHGQLDDIDLTTNARPDAIKRLLGPVSTSLWTQGERFGTIGAIVNGRDLEITSHRAESYDPTSRKPVVVFGDDLNTDLSRRDFSINSMAYSVIHHELHDPFDGMADLEARILRTPDSPEISFVDDPLRMLRAARFIPRFSLTANRELERAVQALGDRLSIVSAERIHDELERLLAVDDPRLGFEFLERTGLLDFVVPGLGADCRHDGCRLASRSSSVPVRRAGLLILLGAKTAESWLKDLRYSTADRRLTLRLIQGAETLLGSPNSAVDIRRLAVSCELEHLGDVLALARNLADLGRDGAADLKEDSRRHNPQQHDLREGGAVLQQRVAQADSLLAELQATEDLSDLESPVTGGELITELEMKPGPLVGRAVAMLTEHRLVSGPFDAPEAFRRTSEWLARLDEPQGSQVNEPQGSQVND